jgi:hypothetical protein
VVKPIAATVALALPAIGNELPSAVATINAIFE